MRMCIRLCFGSFVVELNRFIDQMITWGEVVSVVTDHFSELCGVWGCVITGFVLWESFLVIPKTCGM